MVRITVDAEMRRKLLALREPGALVDENGELLGVVEKKADKSWEPPIESYERPPFGNQRIYSSEEVREALK